MADLVLERSLITKELVQVLLQKNEKKLLVQLIAKRPRPIFIDSDYNQVSLKKNKMFQENVMVPMGDWRHARLKNLSETDKRRDNSKVESGFGKKIANWIGRDMAYPSNVLHFATECGNKKHSATFPKALPEWFIKLFTQPGDWVLDPFTGSGTTNLVARDLRRNSVGIDRSPEYVTLAEQYLVESEGKTYANGKPTRHQAIRGGEHPELSFREASKPYKAKVTQSPKAKKSVPVPS